MIDSVGGGLIPTKDEKQERLKRVSRLADEVGLFGGAYRRSSLIAPGLVGGPAAFLCGAKRAQAGVPALLGRDRSSGADATRWRSEGTDRYLRRVLNAVRG